MGAGATKRMPEVERENAKRYSELSAIKAEALRLASECSASTKGDEKEKLSATAQFLNRVANTNLIERELFTGHILQQLNTVSVMEPAGACEIYVEEFCQQRFNIFGGSHSPSGDAYEILGAAVFLGTALLSSDKIVNSECGDHLNLMANAGDIFLGANAAWKQEAQKLAEEASGVLSKKPFAHGKVTLRDESKEDGDVTEARATAFRLFKASNTRIEDKNSPRGTLVLFRRVADEEAKSEADDELFVSNVAEVVAKTDQMILRAAHTSLDAQELENEQELLDSLTVAKILFKEGGDLMSMLDHIIEHVHAVVSCDRVSIFIIDEQKNELWCKADKGTGFRVPMIRNSIAGHVAYTGEPLNIPDAYKDERFDPKYDKLNDYKTDTILCLPILDETWKTIGVIQAINKTDAQYDAVELGMTRCRSPASLPRPDASHNCMRGACAEPQIARGDLRDGLSRCAKRHESSRAPLTLHPK